MGSRRKTGGAVAPAAYLSRRAISLHGAAALIVGRLARLPCDTPRLAVGPELPRTEGRPSPLPTTFIANAEGFLRGVDNCPSRSQAMAPYLLAIATELSLKAYLLHRDFSDDWNRIHLGHDLDKTLNQARRAGLRDMPAGLSALTTHLTAAYQRHTLQGVTLEIWPAFRSAEACETVRELLACVKAAIGNDAAEHTQPTNRPSQR